MEVDQIWKENISEIQDYHAFDATKKIVMFLFGEFATSCELLIEMLMGEFNLVITNNSDFENRHTKIITNLVSFGQPRFWGEEQKW